METKDWIILVTTVAAIIIGPIVAVWITRLNDERRDKKRRQYNVLHALMRTRAFSLHSDHVSALNLVQLEFYGLDDVDTAFRHYMGHLNSTVPPATDVQANRTFADERQDRFYTLVQKMAAHLGLTFDKADLKRLSYAPQGWQDAEAQQKTLSARIIELLEFRRPLPVKEFHASDVNNKFPPPPNVI